MSTAAPHTQLGLKQYTKEVPPGFRPGAYPVTEYEELVKVWSVLTTLDSEKVGVALYSRLELGALDKARRLRGHRMDQNTLAIRNYIGLDAIRLPASDPVLDGLGNEIFAAQPAGAMLLLQMLVREFSLQDQDKAWISLERFFEHTGRGDDFFEYDQQFESRYADAVSHGGLAMNDAGLAYLYWSKSGVNEKLIADLRLKVDGDLTRFRDMISLHKRILQNEEAALNQNKSKQPYVLLHEDYDDEYGNCGYWTEDGYFYEYDAFVDKATYYDPDADCYYDDYDDYNEYEPFDEYSEEYWQKGKGKGKKPSFGTGKGGKQAQGAQCIKCGSRFHKSEDCPVHLRDDDHGSGKGYPADTVEQDESWNDYEGSYDEDYWQRSKGKGKGRRKGKSFRFHPRRGRGKGFGKKAGNRYQPRFPRPPFSSSSRTSSRSSNTPVHLVLAAGHGMSGTSAAQSVRCGVFHSREFFFMRRTTKTFRGTASRK